MPDHFNKLRTGMVGGVHPTPGLTKRKLQLSLTECHDRLPPDNPALPIPIRLQFAIIAPRKNSPEGTA